MLKLVFKTINEIESLIEYLEKLEYHDGVRVLTAVRNDVIESLGLSHVDIGESTKNAPDVFYAIFGGNVIFTLSLNALDVFYKDSEYIFDFIEDVGEDVVSLYLVTHNGGGDLYYTIKKVIGFSPKLIKAFEDHTNQKWI